MKPVCLRTFVFPTVSACETMCLVFKMWGVYTFVYEIRTTGTARVNRIKDKHSLALLARCSVATVTRLMMDAVVSKDARRRRLQIIGW